MPSCPPSRRQVAALALLPLLLIPALAALDGGLTLAGLRVVQEPRSAAGPTAFNWRPGTGVVLRLVMPGAIAAIDPAACRLETFADSTGRDLAVGATLRVADLHGEEALIEIAGEALPDPQATGLHLTGQVVCLCGGTTVSASSLPTAPAAGTELRAGEVAYRIERFGASEWEEGHHDLVLAASGQETLVGAVELLDPQGAGVAVDTYVESGAAGRRHVFLLADPPPPAVVLRLTLHQDVERITVPFDLRVGLGGGAP